jgi:hypothetical protein
VCVCVQLLWIIKGGKEDDVIQLLKSVAHSKGCKQSRYLKTFGVTGTTDHAIHDGIPWSTASVGALARNAETLKLMDAEQLVSLLQTLSVPNYFAIALHLGAGKLPGAKLQAQQLCRQHGGGYLSLVCH